MKNRRKEKEEKRVRKRMEGEGLMNIKERKEWGEKMWVVKDCEKKSGRIGI